jgi:excisionase family DNA binding protein
MEDDASLAAGISASEPLLGTVREAARLLALGRSTVYELIATGRLPTIHIGRSVRIRSADLRALLASDARETTAM